MSRMPHIRRSQGGYGSTTALVDAALQGTDHSDDGKPCAACSDNACDLRVERAFCRRRSGTGYGRCPRHAPGRSFRHVLDDERAPKDHCGKRGASRLRRSQGVRRSVGGRGMSDFGRARWSTVPACTAVAPRTTEAGSRAVSLPHGVVLLDWGASCARSSAIRSTVADNRRAGESGKLSQCWLSAHRRAFSRTAALRLPFERARTSGHETKRVDQKMTVAPIARSS